MTSSSLPVRRTTTLRAMLESPSLEFLMEAHNGLSAKIAEEAGFRGIWASGLSIASSLGVRDANEASWTQVLEVVEFMADATTVPILVDGDTGYGDFNSVRRLVRKLTSRGIAGVCLEDKIFPKQNSFIRGNQQPLADVHEFAGKIKAARDAAPDADFCVVARVEAFIAGWGLDEALLRAHAYADAGATAILIHSARRDASEVLAFQQAFGKRLPVVVVPTKYYTTPTQVLRDAGFSVAIWANHLMRSALTAMQQTAARIHADEHLLNVESHVAPLTEVFRLQGEFELEDAERRYLPATTNKTRAIVLAASRGKELGALTIDKPKCMLAIGGKPLLQHIVDTYRGAGVRDVSVVRGYCKDAVTTQGITTFDNDAHETTGEVGSLLCAKAAFDGSVVVSYGDVLFQRHVIDGLCDVPDDIVIAVDPSWQSSRNRGERRADLVRCSKPFSRDSFLSQVHLVEIPTVRLEDASASAHGGDRVADGEWMGIMKLSAAGTAAVAGLLTQLSAEGVEVAMLRVPELLRHAQRRGMPVRVLYMAGSWLDVDVVEDLGELAP